MNGCSAGSSRSKYSTRTPVSSCAGPPNKDSRSWSQPGFGVYVLEERRLDLTPSLPPSTACSNGGSVVKVWSAWDGACVTTSSCREQRHQLPGSSSQGWGAKVQGLSDLGAGSMCLKCLARHYRTKPPTTSRLVRRRKGQ